MIHPHPASRLLPSLLCLPCSVFLALLCFWSYCHREAWPLPSPLTSGLPSTQRFAFWLLASPFHFKLNVPSYMAKSPRKRIKAHTWKQAPVVKKKNNNNVKVCNWIWPTPSQTLKFSVSHSWQYQNDWNSSMLDGKTNLGIKHIQTTAFLCLESTNEAFAAVV